MKKVLALCLFVLCTLMPLHSFAENTRATSIEVAKILENPPDDLAIIDIRTPKEYAAGHIEGAVLVDFIAPDFEEKLAKFDKDAPYIMHCRSGARSNRAMVVMENMGFTNVIHMYDGMIGWQENGLPVEK